MNINRILGAAGGAALTAGLVMVATPAGAASGPNATVEDDTLRVEGGSGADQIALTFVGGTPGTVGVDFDGDLTAEETFDVTTFSRVEIDGEGGDDSMVISDQPAISLAEEFTFDGGSGDDTITGSGGNDTIEGGSGDDRIDGNRGTDHADLGSGTDVFTWDPGDGNDTIDGASGQDTLDFNGAAVAENMSLSAEGRNAVFLRNIGVIRMDMDDVESLDLDALAGADSITIGDMSGTGFRTADINLAGAAGGPDQVADTVLVDGTARGDEVDVEPDGAVVEVQGLPGETRIHNADATMDRLQVNGLGGDDDVDFDSRVLALILAAADLGDGQS